jgi:NAD(P)-dependent dehydrogenase (short-subunit alcohol dehydrogenase family)
MTQVFLVTGSSRGLGREIVEAALAAGHHVVATARRSEQLADLVNTYGDRMRAVALDVTDPHAAEAAVRTAVDAFGRLDVVVNNAGYADLAAIEDVSLDAFRAQIETNLFGVVTVTKAALPQLREQGSGHIIQVSSVGGRMASVGLGAYQSAKWAVGGFSSVLNQEVAPLGIKVTVLEPGGMRTDWAGSSMAIPTVSAPYEPTVGEQARMIRAGLTTEASDPAKVARVVLDVAAMAEPPLRLLLGSDAYRYGTAAGRALAESDQQWRELSVSTDHDDATEAQLNPLGQSAS